MAQPDTKLVLLDNLISYACHDPSGDNGKGIPGAVPKEAQKPLLANYGIANEMEYNADLTVCNFRVKLYHVLKAFEMQMLVGLNSHERTVKRFDELLHNSGWRLTKVVRNAARGFLQTVEAVPTF